MAGSFSADKLIATALANLKKVLADAEVETADGMKDIGIEVVNTVKQLLSTPGTGRTYRRRGVLHRASAPGQPPAVDTGKLRASYTYQTGRDAQGPYVDVGTAEKKAPMLEFGTRRMAARPHLRVGVERLAVRIPDMIAEAWANGLKVAIGRLPTEIEVDG